MITNVPGPQDFYDAGHELLDFAWDTVATFWTALADSEDWGVDQEEVAEEYWLAAKKRLASSLAVTQQGVELILKGKVAEISPFLLLSDPPAKWPAAAGSFADYRTVDAQDLLRLLQSVSSTKLPSELEQQYNDLRRSRNRIFHSVDKNLTVTASKVLETILAFNKALFPHQNWAQMRANFIQESPDSALDGGDWARNIACRETQVVMRMLEPAATKKYFGIDKKKHLYQCPHCLSLMNRDGDRLFEIAQLRPPTVASTKLYCPVCNAEHDVIRAACAGCEKNVLDEEFRCLSCGKWNEQDELP